MPESQGTSVKARSCGKTGEKLFREKFLPLGDQMQQLTRLAKDLLTLPAAELLRRNGPHEAMADRSRVVLLDQLAARSQRGQLAAQPAEHPPDGAVVQQPSRIPGRGAGRTLVDPPPTSRTGRFAIGLRVVLQIAGREMKQRRTGVALIGKYESRGNR